MKRHLWLLQLKKKQLHNMRKLFVLFTLLLFVLNVSAQVERNDRVSKGNYYASYSAGANDTITSNDDFAYIVYDNGQFTKYYINASVKLDSIDAPEVDVTLQGRDFNHESWSDISSVTWTGTSSDTTIVTGDESSGVLYRQNRILFEHTSGEAKLTEGNKAIEIEYKEVE